MEMQFFVNPKNDKEWFEYWRDERHELVTINRNDMKTKLRYHDHLKACSLCSCRTDIEYEFPFGWGEIEGIHNRTDFDLSTQNFPEKN